MTSAVFRDPRLERSPRADQPGKTAEWINADRSGTPESSGMSLRHRILAALRNPHHAEDHRVIGDLLVRSRLRGADLRPLAGLVGGFF
jgi:hypothetical protein